MSFASAIYRGEVRHRRHAGRRHEFRYPLYMVYLDLDEIGAVFAQSRWWSARGFAPAWFRRADFLPGRPGSLREAVLDGVRECGGDAARIGPVRVLTHLRYWGFSFNPVSLYYCFAADGITLRHVLLEVHNTPWNERHLYLLGVDAAASHEAGHEVNHEASLAKAFHVSPFMPMAMDYRFRFNTPAGRLAFHMDSFHAGASAFDATLALRREEIDTAALNRVLWRYPLMTLQVVAGIYWQALRLLLKGVRVHAHPRHLSMQAGDRDEQP